jgi:cytochrome P450
MGVPDASDEDMQRWSQTLIDGAGNFGWTPGPFEATDIANAEMDKCIPVELASRVDPGGQAENESRLRAALDGRHDRTQECLLLGEERKS